MASQKEGKQEFIRTPLQDAGSLGWAQPGQSGEIPNRRSGHSFNIIGTNAFLFGGIDHKSPPGPSNEMFCLKLQNDAFAWKKVTVTGDKPLARWRHSATVVDGTAILIFGGFHSSTNRFNDVHIFDTVSLSWSQPIESQCDFTPRGNHIPTKNSWASAPTPRGAHSCNVVDSSMYVFGGYGGSGYSRRDFNDMFTLDLTSFEWLKTKCAGKNPEARSGHTSCVVGKQIFLFGGWNSHVQFNDLYIFDTPTLTWGETNIAFGLPRWNHCACAVEAIPNWKLFVFGGCVGNLTERKAAQGTFVNDIAVLDTGSMIWSYPETTGNPPLARADSVLSYDSKGSRLLLFGGWANRWFDDIHSLDVGTVVGPPYAIMGIEPQIGPITGNQEVNIEGIDFVDTPSVVVRFASKNGYLDVPGEFVSSTNIRCLSPDYSQFGSGIVNVRVSLKGDSFTTTYQKYSYFAVTDAKKCICFGPGVLSGGAAGAETIFIIQAADASGNFRDTGGDEFSVVISNAESGIRLPFELSDGDDGRYMVTYTIPDDEEYRIDIEFKGTYGGKEGELQGSPFIVKMDLSASKDKNSMTGPLVMDAIRQNIADLTKFARQTQAGLMAKVAPDSVKALVKVKEHIHNATHRRNEINLQFERSSAIIEYLETEGGKMGRQRDNLTTAQNLWNQLQEQVPITKTAIAPLVKVHGAKTKVEIAQYETIVAAYVDDFKALGFWFYEIGPNGARRLIDDGEEQHKVKQTECDQYQHLADMFECSEQMEGSQKMMKNVNKHLEYVRDLWDAIDSFLVYQENCRNALWADADANAMEEETKMQMKSIKSTNKEIKWCDAYKVAEIQVKNSAKTWPLITSLHHPSMRPRHWKVLIDKTGRKVEFDDPTLELGHVLDLQLHEFESDVEEICDQAQKEEKMEVLLKNLKSVWDNVNFQVDVYKEGSDVQLLKLAEEDFEQLESDQLQVQTMMGSRFLKTFEAEVMYWNNTLRVVSDVVAILNIIQRTWSYLEPLFIGSAEVRRELPDDAERFRKIDQETKQILMQAAKVKNVCNACTSEGLLGSLENLQHGLSLCKKSLQNFLDGKRRQFPRFYFVSEADLLDLLSNANAPEKLLVHVPKIYLATKTLELTGGGGGRRPKATKWVSNVGIEEIMFQPAVALDGKAEVYLQTILTSMQKTLEFKLGASIERYISQTRIEWLMNTENDEPTDPAQISLIASAVYYVREVEEVFVSIKKGSKQAMGDYNGKQIKQLEDLIRLTQKSGLHKRDRKRIMCMITLDAHSRDIVQRFLRENVTESSAFQWQAQLKATYVNGNAEMSIADAKFDYSYEYLGNGSRLVITPLTDRIYVTATQALHLCMGCAPAGPAGTGKTETTKDLAANLGIVCYVVNCSPEMDYLSMGNIFKGLAASGAWGCFDEFNRLKTAVLSVCTVQFKAVCDSIRGKKQTVSIEGDSINVNTSVGVFITMNPGYLGRSTLPEGLKALFRPITVMVPDLVLICENMLMAEGFQTAKVLARKFYGLYSLLSDLLSPQKHYDWGLRAVKSVLVVAGAFKRAEKNLAEDALLLRALRDFNTPKIVQEDEVVFFGLLKDLFPGIDPPRKVDPDLDTACRNACAARKIWPDEGYLRKCIELEELLAIRHCVFVMGEPGSGKSEVWKTLAAARGSLGHKTTCKDINPKAVTPEELYGYISFATREWKDGVLSQVMRDLGNLSDGLPKWIILDGDLDANWIESMNSVMDDNRMLTLASNERVPLNSNMRMLFEIRDLNYATPATVSRAGILYVSAQKGSQWRSLIASWVQKLPESFSDEAREALGVLFERYCGPVVKFLKKEMRTIVPMPVITLVQSLLSMLQCVLRAPEKYCLETAVESEKAMEPIFVFCAIWAFGSSTSEKDGIDYRKMFSDYWRSTWKNIRIPARETVFDYYLDTENNSFDQWKNSEYFFTVNYDSSIPMSHVTVPTPETAAISHWLVKLISLQKPVMLIGLAGCGKTQLVNGTLSGLNSSDRLTTLINFNYFTNAKLLQATMETPLEKKTGTNYGPPGAKARMVYFLDDLNLPEVDPYNTQSALALIRQHVDYGHWYDLSKDIITAKNIRRCHYVACMNHTAGSFEINPRLQRHFSVFAIGFPGPTSLLTIYQTFLDGHLSRFSGDIQQLSSNLINAALVLHTGCVKNFRKTAKNFHYEFNLRHLSNVFQGLLVAVPDRFSDPAKFVQLWLHESERVYGDLLVSKTHLDKYKLEAQTQAKRRFPAFNMAKYFAAENADPLIFCHFSDGYGEEELEYDQVTSIDSITDVFMAALQEHNEENAAMNLVLFADAIRHICRISRIVLNPAGHALLVGVGGSGKRSLSRLAAYACAYTVKQITITSNYTLNDFKADLQLMYKRAGLKDEGIMFIFTDSQITNERFLVYMNDLLSSGNVPDLFSTEETDDIVSAISPKVKASGIVVERANCWDFFIKTVRRNLHVVLSFSPMSDAFRVRARRFPALVNCTSVDWFQPWPKDALYRVGQQFLSQADIPDDIRAGVESFMPYSFESVNEAATLFLEADRRYCYTTPKSYLELLKLYVSMLAKKREESTLAVERLSSGLDKLRSTAEIVGRLEEDLKVRLDAAEIEKEKAEGMAETVAKEKAIVEVEEGKAREEAAKCGVIQEEVSVIQKDAEEDLKNAEPLVLQAMAALETLDKKEIGECKTMAKPPKGVDDVFAAIMVLLAGIMKNIPVQKNGKVRERSWDSAKKSLLTNISGFLTSLKGYKQFVDNFEVPKINWKEVRPYLAMEHFNVETIESKNRAAAGLCAWVINIVKYHDTIVSVEPKRMALKDANARLLSANDILEKVTVHVADLTARLKKLTDAYDEANRKKQAAIDEVELGQRRLDLAQRLTGALGSEKVRWAENVVELKARAEFLIGDVLLACSFISYIGPFTKSYRDRLLNEKWVPFLSKALGLDENMQPKGVPISPDANPLSILCTEADVAKWNSFHLPADRVSIENAAITTSSARWPLLIDPQLQAIAWMKEMVKDDIKLLRLGMESLMSDISSAIEGGKTVVIENMSENIDAVLMPIVSRQVYSRGKRLFIKLGEDEFEWNSNFKLLLHTKLANPHFPPEIQAETTLVNFTVTEQGLEDQLLSLVVRKERSDLAEERAKLIQQDNQFKIKLKELEDEILSRLASAEGDVTTDVALIEALEDAKRTSNDIQAKMEVANMTQEGIQETSEKYRDVAARGALLFFLMNSLNRVHSYYMYSLNAFVVTFLRGIDLVSEAKSNSPGKKSLLSRFKKAAKKVILVQRFSWNSDILHGHSLPQEPSNGQAKDVGVLKGSLSDEQLTERCLVLVQSITSIVFNYIRRGLFDEHKLTVALQLTLKCNVQSNVLQKDEVSAIIFPLVAKDPGGKGLLTEWMPDAIWSKCKGLEEQMFSVFKGFGDELQSDSDEWKEWFDSSSPEETKMPGKYAEFSTFQHLLILRALRPDRLKYAISKYIGASLGNVFISQPPFDMNSAYQESSPATPIFFTLFPGVDPTSWVEMYGEKLGIMKSGKYQNISMGQGQEQRAEIAIKEYSEGGGWIFLQNVHLMTEWLPSMERALEKAAESAHQDFRCFISAEPPPLPHMKILPESLLQSCIKVMNEAPADLKSNLQRAWANFSEELVNGCSKPKEFKSSLFTLCFFHSVVLGRRKFGQQGWSSKYSFNTGDLMICASVCQSYISGNETVPWDDLRYIFGQIMYGGHITDFWDRRTNITYLEVLFQPKIFSGCELVPCYEATDENPELFLSPDPNTSYLGYKEYIDDVLPGEAPKLFGLHPNAEIGYLTSMADSIFNTILSLHGGGNGAGDSDTSLVVRDTLCNIFESLPKQFDMIDITERAESELSTEEAPYIIVVMQECTAMNVLLSEMRRSIDELQKGLDGALNMTDAMEDLASALSIKQVPGRNPFHKCSWETLAWWSKKTLTSWYLDLQLRVNQLVKWSMQLKRPFCVWLSGLFNPASFNTAIMQATSRAHNLPLDNMTVETNITALGVNSETPKLHPTDGAFVSGFFIEGARWFNDEDECEDYEVSGTKCRGYLTDARIKELIPLMPLIYIKAVQVESSWEPSAVGYMRHDSRLFECPVYQTTFRGPTYVFLATLQTVASNTAVTQKSKWVLRGVALILQTDD
jgi:dynein heavy chain, axonemal